MTKKSDTERDEAIAKLRDWLPPGSTLHTVLRHVSKSGMQREIGCVLIKNGDTLHPNYSVAKALGDRQGKHDGIIVGGCGGMDMGFHLVYSLAATIYRDGFECIGKGCPSNDHGNGDRNYEPHHHRDGGYAIKHRWI